MVSAVALAESEAAKPHSRFTSGPAIALYLALAKLLLHLLTATRYGIFRDEMYYVACSQHLAWGYVDHPPMNILIAWFARHAFGDSLLGLRLLPAIAGAGLVWMAGQLAREMGGGRFAQSLAALAVIPVPIYLIMHHWLTMNAFEPLLWMSCLWCVVTAINRGEPRYWFWFGVLPGLGSRPNTPSLFLCSAYSLESLSVPSVIFSRAAGCGWGCWWRPPSRCPTSCGNCNTTFLSCNSCTTSAWAIATSFGAR